MKLQRVKTLKAAKRPIESVITKGADGRRYMLIFTSNGYKDREDEHVRTAALQEYVDSCWSQGGQWQGDNQHLYWHVKQLHIGDIVWAGMLDGFLVEVSRERDTPIAKTVWDYLETTPIKHGASQGFRPLTARTESGIYNHIRKFETSTLPLEFAANIGTLSEVIMVTKDIKIKGQASTLDEIFGIEGVYDILKREGIEGLQRRLAALGIQAKSLSTETVYKAKDTPVNKANDITAEDAKRITALAARAANHSIGEKYLARLIEIYGLDETERFLLIASGSIEKSLSSRAPLYDPTYPGLNVPLTAQQRAEAIVEKTIAQHGKRDGFWGDLGILKKR